MFESTQRNVMKPRIEITPKFVTNPDPNQLYAKYIAPISQKCRSCQKAWAKK